VKHTAFLLPAAVCLVQACPAPLRAQDAEVNDRLVPLLEILALRSDAPTEEVLAAIRELAGLGVETSAGASALLSRASILHEPDPEVRVQALVAFPRCCPERDLRNRIVAMRIVRAANPALEPEARVRRAAIGALAGFRCAEASERIYESSLEAGEPDAEVRSFARDLVAKGH
jgi:hypothetical protein